MMLMGNAVAKDQKIGMVDVKSITPQMPQMVALNSILQAEFKNEIEELKELQTDLKYNYDKMQRNDGAMSNTQIEKFRKKVLDKKILIIKKRRHY
nr:OmpH family outer membrane protein [Candidatus Colwellia aromaticivorans]